MGEGWWLLLGRRSGARFSNVRIALLGAGGGAGQAAARYLAELNVPALILLNRTVAKAERLASELADCSNSSVRAEPWEKLPKVCMEVDLIVNASTVGPTPEVLNSIEPRHLVFDMVYGPQETPLVHYARRQGAKAGGWSF